MDIIGLLIHYLERIADLLGKPEITAPAAVFFIVFMAGYFVSVYFYLGKKGGILKKIPSIYIYILLSLIVASESLYFYTFITDDAYITFRYARNLVKGYGLVFNPGDSPLEGYTNFLWVIVSAIPLSFGADPTHFIKILSIILNSLTLIVVCKITEHYGGRGTASAAGAFYILLFPLQIWSIGGLETPLFLLLLAISTFFFLENYLSEKPNKKHPYYTGAGLLLLSLTRIEGIVYFIGFIISVLLIALLDERRKNISIKILKGFIPFAVIYGVYFIWRIFYFGRIFPNSFTAKSTGAPVITAEGIVYAVTFIIFTLPIFIPALIPVFHSLNRIFGKLKRKSKGAYSRKERGKTIGVPGNTIKYLQLAIVGIVIVSINLGIILILKSFNAAQGFRFALPSLIFIIPLGVIGYYHLFGIVRKGLSNRGKNKRQTDRFVAVLILLFSASSAVYPIVMPVVHENTSFTYVNDTYYKFAKWLADNTPADTVIAFSDMGIIPFYSDRYFIDTWGLLDPYIAEHGFNAKYVIDKNPDLIMVKTVIDVYNFSTDPRFVQNYTEFYRLRLIEVDYMLNNYTYYIVIYKRRGFDLSNSTLIELFG